MKATDAVREIMKNKGKTLGDVAKAIADDTDGKAIPVRRISERLSQENISIKLLDEMVRVLGYKIVLMPIDETTPDNAYTVK